MIFLEYAQPRAGSVDSSIVVYEKKQAAFDDPSEVRDFLTQGSVTIKGVVHRRTQVDLFERQPLPHPVAQPRPEFIPCDEFP